jgi:predicted DNA-binding transcriptional regulator YafY
MARTERIYRIESLIRHRGAVSFAALIDTLEVSPATLKRDLEYLRSRLGAPIIYDRELNAYRFDDHGRGERHELPGLWFDENELYALLMAYQLLAGLDSDGLLARHLQPLLQRIQSLLGSDDGAPGSGEGTRAQTLMQRVRIVSTQRRPVPGPFFERVSAALLARRRLHLVYLSRGRAERGEREVSPQRLVHHRHTWYLDAWCHRVRALRRFALDAMEQAQVLDTAAQEVPLAEVAAAMDAGYGIYAGGRRRWALLVFSVHAAQWASREEWHAEQQGRFLPDGRWQLRLPYVDDTELLMDLLRHGEQVQVLQPAALRRALHSRLQAAAALYTSEAPVPPTR